MANIFGIEIDNLTSNTVSVELFQLGNVGSSKIVNGVLATSQTIVQTIDAPSSLGQLYYFTGDTTEIDSNLNTFYSVNTNEVYLSTSTANPSNPNGVRKVIYADGTFDDVLLSQFSPPVSISDFTTEIASLFEAKVGESDVIFVNATIKIRNTGAIYQASITFNVNYLISESYLLNTVGYTQIQQIEIENTVLSNAFPIPINGVSALPNNWNVVFSTTNGVIIKGTTGTDYGEFLQALIGEPSAINSLRITPLESNFFNEKERISQLLETIKFTRVDANGKLNTYALNPTVDLYQNMTTLDYINLGSKTDDFPLDGNTIFAYQLLPFAKVNIQLDYVQTSNFVFANKELIREIVELNKKKNKEVQYRSTIAKEYELKL